MRIFAVASPRTDRVAAARGRPSSTSFWQCLTQTRAPPNLCERLLSKRRGCGGPEPSVRLRAWWRRGPSLSQRLRGPRARTPSFRSTLPRAHLRMLLRGLSTSCLGATPAISLLCAPQLQHLALTTLSSGHHFGAKGSHWALTRHYLHEVGARSAPIGHRRMSTQKVRLALGELGYLRRIEHYFGLTSRLRRTGCTRKRNRPQSDVHTIRIATRIRPPANLRKTQHSQLAELRRGTTNGFNGSSLHSRFLRNTSQPPREEYG